MLSPKAVYPFWKIEQLKYFKFKSRALFCGWDDGRVKVSSIMNSFILVNYFCLKYPLVFLLGLHVYHIFELSKLKGVW
jgi:hypothetical protein